MVIKAKKKKILILTYGSVNHASSWVRALQYIPILENNGYRVVLQTRVPYPKNKLQMITFPFLKRFYLLKRIFLIGFLKFDLVFIQRWFLPVYLLRLLEIRKIPFIYDFDDAIYLNTEREKLNGAKTVSMIKKAAKVCVSSPVLVSFAKSMGFSQPLFIHLSIAG